MTPLLYYAVPIGESPHSFYLGYVPVILKKKLVEA
jgi:hypothetical protein